MDTAFDLFTSQGIVKTSIDDIAKRAGIAKGTFYLYFKDKYDLQNRLIAHKTKAIFDHALANSGHERIPTLDGKILAVVDDILDQLKDDKLLLRFIYKNLSWGVFRRAIENSEDEFLRALEPEGESALSRDDAAVVAYTILELTGSACYSVILYNDPVDLDTYKPYLHRSIKAILAEFGAEKE